MNQIKGIEDVNFADPDIQNCPYEAYDIIREEGPVYWEAHFNVYVVTRYEDIRAILKDADTFSSQVGDAEYRDLSTQTKAAELRNRKIRELYEKEGWPPKATLSGRDDPGHKQMRAMFDRAFRPGRIKELDPFVRDTAYQLIDDFIDEGECNWVSQFAVPLPLFIIGKQMGVKKQEDLWQIKVWTDAFFRQVSMMLDEAEEIETVRMEIEAQHYFQPIFENLRKDPDDTLLSDLVNTMIEEWGRPLDDNELHAAMMSDTFVGGSETTTNALSAGMKLLIENPSVWDQLKSDPERWIRPFVEETLRLESPVQGLNRIATKDTELGGVKIPRGAALNLRFAAANRDPRMFDCPADLDLERKNAGAHLAFGSGVHHCLGAPLARRELWWGFKALCDRIDEMWFLEGKNTFECHPHFLLRSLKELHIGFKPKRT